LFWESNGLSHEWASASVNTMRVYEAEMAYALDALGWNGRSVSAHAAERTTANRGS